MHACSFFSELEGTKLVPSSQPEPEVIDQSDEDEERIRKFKKKRKEVADKKKKKTKMQDEEQIDRKSVV